MNPINTLSLSATPGGDGSTPEHKRFKTLMEKLDKERQRLQRWQEQLPLFAQAWQQRVQPEKLQLQQQQRTAALALEQLLLKGRWSKSERETLTREMLALCEELLDSEEPDSPLHAEMKDLFNRHAELDFDAENDLELQVMKETLETMGGLDLGSEPFESADDLFQKAREQMAQRGASEREAFEQAAQMQRKPPRKKQSAAALRAEEEARQATQTVREVYRKLAAALHPDRVGLSASAEERERCTQLMQQANAAYEKNDLLALLTLQLQIEQVDQAQASRLAASQVKHFNKVLAEQLKELQAEVDNRQNAFEMSYGFFVDARIDPARLGKLINEVIQQLQRDMIQLRNMLLVLSGPPAMAKRYLKMLRAKQRQDDLMPDFW
jgi:hypothetical protein